MGDKHGTISFVLQDTLVDCWCVYITVTLTHRCIGERERERARARARARDRASAIVEESESMNRHTQ